MNSSALTVSDLTLPLTGLLQFFYEDMAKPSGTKSTFLLFLNHLMEREEIHQGIQDSTMTLEDVDSLTGSYPESAMRSLYQVLEQPTVTTSDCLELLKEVILIRRIQENDPTLNKVDFVLDHKGDKHLVTLATAFKTNTVVDVIFIRGSSEAVTIDGWKAIFEMLQKNKTINFLKFVPGEFSAECIQLFAATVLSKNNTITTLAIGCSPIGVLGNSPLVDTLCSNPNGCKLKYLSFSGLLNNNDTKEAKIHFAETFMTLLQPEYCKLKGLCLHRCNLGDDFVTRLATALKYSTSLKYLSITDNQISVIGAKALAKVLYYNKTLVGVSLAKNLIGDEGAIALITALQYHPSLKNLNISYNNISENVVENVFNFLQYNESVEKLFCWQRASYAETQHQHHKALLQKMLDYNDSLQYLRLDYGRSLRVRVLNESGDGGKRTAAKKGLRRKQDILKWLPMFWV